MNITLFSFDDELYCLGIRILSSCLGNRGHSVKIMFMPPAYAQKRHVSKFQTTYSRALLDSVVALCADAHLIGMSLMTNQFIQAVHVTHYLKQHGVNAPIMWGGIEPTVEPDTSLLHADMVCLGEGEEALIEVVERVAHNQSCLQVRNLCMKANGGIIRNPPRSLVEDLDTLPFPDYSCRQHYLGIGGRLEPLTREHLLNFKGERFNVVNGKLAYPIMTSRGCAFSCSYCCNSVYRDLYPTQKRLRFRSAANVMSEVEMIEQEVAPIATVLMVDDNFTARPAEGLRRFCTEFKARIGKPFYCQVSPLTIDEEKMQILIENGCIKVTMGVETASERIAAMYNRSHFHRKVRDAIALLEKYRTQMELPPTYQFIIDNPYETVEETVQTLKLATELKKPWDNPVYSLMLFPGTPLYQKALGDGIIKDPYQQIYGRNWLDQSMPFFQFWISLYRANFPRFLLRFLLCSWVVRLCTGQFFNRLFKRKHAQPLHDNT